MAVKLLTTLNFKTNSQESFKNPKKIKRELKLMFSTIPNNNEGSENCHEISQT